MIRTLVLWHRHDGKKRTNFRIVVRGHDSRIEVEGEDVRGVKRWTFADGNGSIEVLEMIGKALEIAIGCGGWTEAAKGFVLGPRAVTDPVTGELLIDLGQLK